MNFNNYNNIIFELQQELQERKKILGSHHSLVADSLTILGLTYLHSVGDQEKAILMHREALHIFKLQPPNQDNLMKSAIALADIGNCLWRKGDYLGARSEYLRSLAFFQNSLISEDYPQAKLCKYSILRCFGQLNGSITG